jgi:hypothetical protein
MEIVILIALIIGALMAKPIMIDVGESQDYSPLFFFLWLRGLTKGDLTDKIE